MRNMFIAYIEFEKKNMTPYRKFVLDTVVSFWGIVYFPILPLLK